MGTETSKPSTAAQVVAAIGQAEIPRGESQELLPMLLSKVSPEASEELKASVMEATGYMCEGIVSFVAGGADVRDSSHGE